MIFICFTRESNKECSPDPDLRIYLPNGIYKLFCFLTCDLPAHSFQYRITDVLQRHVKIIADLRMLFHDINYLKWKFVRISIMQSYPFNALYTAQFFKQFRQSASLIKVKAIICELLCDKNKLFYTSFCKMCGFMQQALNSPGFMRTSHERNSTK